MSYSRRSFLGRSAATGIGLTSVAGLRWLPERACGAESTDDRAALAHTITDPSIRTGVEAAVFKNMLPAATERHYPGYFTITADGVSFGSDTTWPGLDSWQMAGAYLLLGRTRLVMDFFDFVRASQRKDGNIPFAIFNGDTRPGGCLRGLNYPDDLFTYKPPPREGRPASSREPRQWIGLFEHWQTKGFPLAALGSICYILTAAEIHQSVQSVPWLGERLESVEAAARFLLTKKTSCGLMGGSGFYVEAPPREGSDGVTQCYAIHAFRELAGLFRAAGDQARANHWSTQADTLAQAFGAAFWRDDHFGEYVHPERGLVDLHGLSDVNWAAIAFGVASAQQADVLWPRLLAEPGFWLGDMPTQLVTKPSSYEPWELNRSAECSVSEINDVAAMGRVWHLEILACRRMRAHDRLVDSVRKVCRAAKADGHWRERYHPKPDGTVAADGAQKYCEYAAVLVRAVYGHRALFWKH
ncbi:MAG TPA: hypothetical protein PKY77_01010 [Phycisphaerae bacterium]|nr:hypothetical protein [Phycisphaerae bacterium]HRY67565.1 hypothetical protein [Phycisphaerae bacterium]HSA24952.1 hypothetical protein [Phycisphaerae bacterium]